MADKQPILIVYDNGSMDKADMSTGTLRSLGQQIIAMADNAMMPGNMPPAIEEEINNDN
ncbi:MAG: hypothetical protein JRJ85_14320 [Deltaproteobacteria bacterium]|nr:hypothetical protein [Deltaproteobacteria bacterium]